MFKDNNKLVNELMEEFELEAYDLVANPSIDFNSLLSENTKILDGILTDLLIEARNHKIDNLTQTDNYK